MTGDVAKVSPSTRYDAEKRDHMDRLRADFAGMTSDEIRERERARAQILYDGLLTDMLDAWDDPSLEQVRTAMYRLGRNYAPALVFDLHCEGRLMPEVAAWAVPDAWSSAEFPEDYVVRDLWLELFGVAGYTHNGASAERPAEPIRLYRGAPASHRARMAWTANIDRALWFADRFPHLGPADVWTAMVGPERLLAAILDGRNEAEYVINPQALEIARWSP